MRVATAEDDNGHAGLCECTYVTSGWPTAEIAAERIAQHRNEHETGELMEVLSEFRARHGLVAEGSRAVFPDDAVEVD